MFSKVFENVHLPGCKKAQITKWEDLMSCVAQNSDLQINTVMVQLQT